MNLGSEGSRFGFLKVQEVRGLVFSGSFQVYSVAAPKMWENIIAGKNLTFINFKLFPYNFPTPIPVAKFTHTFEYEIMNDIIKMSGSIKNESEIYFEIHT